MKITYIGAHDSVLVVALGCHVAKGETLDAADDIATQLLEQGSYPEHTRQELDENGETVTVIVPAGPGTEWRRAGRQPKSQRLTATALPERLPQPSRRTLLPNTEAPA